MRGHLVIADISGYTRFLTESELEHANGIIEDLLNSTIAAIDAPLRLSSIEGDAILLYGELVEGTVGQTMVESVERLYVAFSGALETMVLNTTCQCNACVNINTLGMKIVMHCGEFTMSSIGGRETITGPDVILAHRLLKNHVIEETGIEDYLLLTQACVEALGIEAIVGGWTQHTEEYEHVGSIDGYVASLKDVWEFTRSQNEDKIVQRDAWFTVNAYSAAPPDLVWDFLINPIKRTSWMQVNSSEVKGTEGGRIGPGSEYHCAHGPDNEISIFSVIDMKAVDYVTFVSPVAPGVAVKWTEYVIGSGGGSRLINYTAEPFNPESGEKLDPATAADFLAGLSGAWQDGADRLVVLADQEISQRQPA